MGGVSQFSHHSHSGRKFSQQTLNGLNLQIEYIGWFREGNILDISFKTFFALCDYMLVCVNICVHARGGGQNPTAGRPLQWFPHYLFIYYKKKMYKVEKMPR